MTTAPVSVLVSTYNRAQMLRKALASIIDQSLRPRQIIVVNDGSSDETVNVLDHFKSAVTAVHQVNQGKSRALNRALPLATEDFLWVFDDDDIAFPDALDRHIALLDQRPDCHFTYSPQYHARTVDDCDLAPLFPQELPAIADEDLFYEMLQRCVFHQQGSIFRRSCIEVTGGYREDLRRSLDYEFLLRLVRSFRGCRLEEPTYYYRFHHNIERPQQTEGRRDAWYEHDKMIFGDLLQSLTIDDYVPPTRARELPADQKESFSRIVRAGVMARKGLWQPIIEDLDRIGEVAPLSEANQHEFSKLFGKVFAHRLPIDDMLKTRRAVSALAKAMRRLDPAVRRDLARALYWTLMRERRRFGAKSCRSGLFAVARLAGLRGGLQAIG